MNFFLEAGIRTVLIFVFLLVTVLLLIWVERKFVSDLQNRVGPDKAGPWGILQSLADGVKAFFKEQIRPTKAEFWLYAAAPVMALVPALLIFMVVPMGKFTIGDTEYVMVGAVIYPLPHSTRVRSSDRDGAQACLKSRLVG